MQDKRKKPTSEHYVNNDIPYPKLFVLGSDGQKVGVLTKSEALELAKNEKMDLVLISVDPKPIARILDYGKFKYDRKKKQKENKEKQTTIQNREIRLTPMIGENDLLTKSKKAREFLLKGDRIKVSVKLRGREIGRKDLGENVLNKFFTQVENIADKTTEPKLVNERFLDMNLQPNKIKIAKYLKEKNQGNNQTKDSQEGE
ncbi:translation initiation factor IF-3 [Mycoplasmopsis felis]|uniref:translation initiation factor IF-3 n=1 Tax=Mycoplasmopsis felis TaxID=33923 RepID=UPI002AFE9847|nr:translation initiation factor IF-3 [Mycoplasmopsis felis]WQQ06579.1 translation initiation factor IF-3 [Mycoplasmopsis felis]WQQ07377.1 translation initiation factor IF-3 [Mycoplasmopsis felis]WQQ08107.1 translation initiation factor IF-3 [Mycoplasmopsis felis]WQQ10504.1 translation initiation factor IF-3 [Mycoplasmopsis felis]WQQ11255.1 translation initiation factor IF-3 [Mycoplasmopsis felis]